MPQRDSSSHLLGWLESKKLKLTSVDKDVEKLGPSDTAGRNVKWCSHCHRVWQFFRTSNIEFPRHSAIPFSGLLPRQLKIYVHKQTYTQMFIKALFLIVPKCKQPNYVSRNKWINKLWYILTVESYLAIKRKTCYNMKALCSARHKRPRMISFL